MNETYTWYSKLIKPSWAPPSWVFGPAWTFLYTLIAISFGRVFWLAWQGKIGFIIVLPFILNLVFNFAFSPIQFTLQNNFLAAIDILLVLGTLIWAMIAIYPYASWITYMQIPYVLWVTFATTVQLTVTYLNR
jgi:tryptophan-rich sensory protein